MNDEIEEILDKIQKCKDYDDEVLLIKQYGATLILDYITNLQQAIKDTKDTADDMLYELKQENERLKETNVYCNRTDCSGRIKNSRKYDSVYQEKEDYKSRVEKATEKLSFIDEALENDTLNVPLCIAKINSALNILQNGSEENGND